MEYIKNKNYNDLNRFLSEYEDSFSEKGKIDMLVLAIKLNDKKSISLMDLTV